MRKRGIVVSILLIAGVIAVVKVYGSHLRFSSGPMNAEVRQLRALAEEAVPLLNKFKDEHGTYPCYLHEVLGPKAAEFDRPPPRKASYLATSAGYYLFVYNPDATSVIHWGNGQPALTWVPCTAGGSCPPGDFATYCCDRANYPKCDSNR